MRESIPVAKDRRDSPRVPVHFRVRGEGAADFEEATGLLGLNGLLWKAGHTVQSQHLELRIRIPGEAEEVSVQGELLGRKVSRDGAAYPIRFGEVSTDAALALARYLDEVAVGWE